MVEKLSDNIISLLSYFECELFNEEYFEKFINEQITNEINYLFSFERNKCEECNELLLENLEDAIEELDGLFKEDIDYEDTNRRLQKFNEEKIKRNKIQNEFLKNVCGLKFAKEELFNLFDWFINSNKYIKEGIDVPHGVLIYGDPGNGKSLLIGEIKKTYKEIPFFYFDNDNRDTLKALSKLFNEAKQYKKSIIAIDELDLLIDEDDILTRFLQEKLDGVEKDNNIFVLCACNDIDDIPYPLLRKGRIERKIFVDKPNKDDIKEFLIYLFKKYNILNYEDIINEDILRALEGNSFAEIKSIVNDVLLRFGKDDINVEKFYKSICITENDIQEEEKQRNFSTCIHEAGHCVAALRYIDLINVRLLKYGERSSFTRVDWKIPMNNELALKTIEIMTAGTSAEKLFFKRFELGNQNDVKSANLFALKLISDFGFKGFKNKLFNNSDDEEEFKSTARSIYKVENLKNKIIKKCEKSSYRYLKIHKLLIYKMAKELYRNKILTPKDILRLYEKYN